MAENDIKEIRLEKNYHYIIPHTQKFAHHIVKELFNRELKYNFTRKVSYIVFFNSIIYLYIDRDEKFVICELMNDKIIYSLKEENIKQIVTNILCKKLHDIFIKRLIYDQNNNNNNKLGE